MKKLNLMELIGFILVFILGFIGALIGSVAAGAGLIIVPGLLLLGLPPHIALGVDKIGSIGFRLGAFINYFRHKIIVWRLVLPFTILGIAGTIIGAKLVISINEAILTKAIGIILIILLPFLFLKKGIGTIRKKISKAKELFSHFLYFLLSIWSGFFSPGSGFLSIYLQLNGYGLTILQGKGTTRIPYILADLSGAIVFLIAGLTDLKIGAVLFLGNFAGSYVGSYIAIKKGNEWIKPLLATFIVIACIKLIFF